MLYHGCQSGIVGELIYYTDTVRFYKHTSCQHLGLDMSEDKNRFPHDFKRWHDIRIDEYATKKAMEDEEKRKELYTKFAEIANKYNALHTQKEAHLSALSPTALLTLSVYGTGRIANLLYPKQTRTGYTIRYGRILIEKQKVLQCYGEHDHKPSEDVLHYVNKIWLPYANKQIKQIAA